MRSLARPALPHSYAFLASSKEPLENTEMEKEISSAVFFEMYWFASYLQISYTGEQSELEREKKKCSVQRVKQTVSQATVQNTDGTSNTQLGILDRESI